MFFNGEYVPLLEELQKDPLAGHARKKLFVGFEILFLALVSFFVSLTP